MHGKFSLANQIQAWDLGMIPWGTTNSLAWDLTPFEDIGWHQLLFYSLNDWQTPGYYDLKSPETEPEDMAQTEARGTWRKCCSPGFQEEEHKNQNHWPGRKVKGHSHSWCDPPLPPKPHLLTAALPRQIALLSGNMLSKQEPVQEFQVQTLTPMTPYPQKIGLCSFLGEPQEILGCS